MVLGMVFGHSEKMTATRRASWQEKWLNLRSVFWKNISKILGHDISKPGEMDKVLEKGLMFDLCPQIVLDVLSILEELV